LTRPSYRRECKRYAVAALPEHGSSKESSFMFIGQCFRPERCQVVILVQT
jgi:hypothetical protein